MRNTRTRTSMFLEGVKAMCSTVTIIHEKEESSRFGSGFVIKRSGDESVIITCRHCIEDFDPANHTLRIRFVMDDEVRELPATILFVSGTEADVTLISVDGLSAPPLRFSEVEMSIGQNKVTIGHCRPDNLWEDENDEFAIPKFHASCPGRVEKIRRKFDLVMKGVGLNGMSGGPTLSRKGVAGMATKGALGHTVSITTEGIKHVLRVFLTDRNIQLTEMSSIHHMLHAMPLK